MTRPALIGSSTPGMAVIPPEEFVPILVCKKIKVIHSIDVVHKICTARHVCYDIFQYHLMGQIQIQNNFIAPLHVHVYCFFCPPPWRSHWGDIEMLGVRPCVRPSQTLLAR